MYVFTEFNSRTVEAINKFMATLSQPFGDQIKIIHNKTQKILPLYLPSPIFRDINFSYLCEGYLNYNELSELFANHNKNIEKLKITICMILI